MDKKLYSVWVGGVEMNETYLNKRQAKICKKYWKSQGYDDIHYRKEIKK